MRLFLTNPRKPFTLSSLNCEGYQKIDFHQELVFVEGKYLMDIKTVELCSYALQRKKRKLEFMSRKRKSYLGKVVENSSLLCAVAANVGRQFGEFFNRSLLLLRFNLNLPPLSSQSLFASLGSPFTFSPISEEKSRCHP